MAGMQVFDTTVVPRAVLMALMAAGAFAGLGGVVFLHLQTPVYARPLSYHVDVMLQR